MNFFKNNKWIIVYLAPVLLVLSIPACSNEHSVQKDGVQKILSTDNSRLVEYAGKGTYTVDISGDELRISIEPVNQQDDTTSHLFTFELEGWDSQECKLYRITGDNQTEVPLMNLPLIQFEALPGDYLVIR